MIAVAGGGVAGAASAILLAEAGCEVTLIERAAGPAHKVCGEFISGEARIYLEKLGLDMASLGGQAVANVRLVRGGQVVTAALPFTGLGVTRKILDEALLRRAAQAGAIVRRGHAIRRISFQNQIKIEIDQSDALNAQTLMLATGKHEMRGMPRIARPSRFVGFKTHFQLSPAQLSEVSNHVELILFRGGYAGLQCVEDGATNLSLLVDAAVLKRIGGKWSALLDYLQSESPHLAGRLAGATELLPAPLTVARVPFGFSHKPCASDPPGLFRLGDQAAVIQSFTGDGMAIALHSAALASFHVAAGHAAQEYHRCLRADIYGQLHRAAALHAITSTPLLGAVAFAGAQYWPSILARAATWTRIPEKSQYAV
ncbi:MAG: NAD-binding protein [Rhodospirillales bacterium]|nr:NAD-binding protein [Rhodospirillales bacterium]